MVGSRFEKSTPARRNTQEHTHTPATLPCGPPLTSFSPTVVPWPRGSDPCNCRKFQPPELQILVTLANSSLQRGAALGPKSNRGNCTLPSGPPQIPATVANSSLQRLRSLKLSQIPASRGGKSLGPKPNRVNCTLAVPEARIPETVANSSLQRGAA